MKPSYLKNYEENKLKTRIEKAWQILESCTLCPRRCQKNRLADEKGDCGSGLKLKVSSYSPHHGEEPYLSGTKGSGTIFFTNCSLNCIFCQNYQISQERIGEYISEEKLAEMMLDLQRRGCHNINLVSPTHFVPQILKALEIAIKRGLKLPLVYNTNSYDSFETLKLLEGIIDIYLPDIKYSDNKTAQELSNVPNYVINAQRAICEMFRQVGNVVLDKNKIAHKGIILRHLVLPEDLAGSFVSLDFLATLSKDICIGIMAQYRPCYKAKTHPQINRKITYSEYYKVVKYAKKLGFTHLLTQELISSDIYLPDFASPDPFVV
jgi:putative pyruvate formate lyase activating enzyme